MNRGREYWCCGEDKVRDLANFITSLNPRHNKYIPLCKTCLSSRFRTYRDKMKSEGAALYCLCMEVGYPMIKEFYDCAVKISAEKSNSSGRANLFTIYHNVLKDRGFVVEGPWQSDMQLSDFIELTTETTDSKRVMPVDEKQLEKVWGKYTQEEYLLLEEFFEMYTKDLPNMDVALELRYRDLCKAELRKRKADESGDIGEIDKAQKNLKSMLDMLGLNNYTVKDSDERKLFLERLIWKIEETEPAEEEDEAVYRDVAGYESIYNSFMRSMRNLLAGSRDYPEIPKEEQ